MGERIQLPYTRGMVTAAMNGELDDVEMRKDTFFGLEVPTQIPDVPEEVLEPRRTWKDQAAYDEAARGLVARFEENFKQYEGD